MIFEKDLGEKDVIRCIPPASVLNFWRTSVDTIAQNVANELRANGKIFSINDIERFLVRRVASEVVQDFEWSKKNGYAKARAWLDIPIFHNDWRAIQKAYGIGMASSVTSKLVVSRIYHLKKESRDISQELFDELMRVVR